MLKELKQENLASKTDITEFVKKTDFDAKLKNILKKLLQIKQNMKAWKRAKCLAEKCMYFALYVFYRQSWLSIF